MQVSKFLKLDVDVLLEWIYDDQNFIIEDYRIIVDTLFQTRGFSQTEKTGIVDSTTNNSTEKQLFLLDRASNKWGIVDSNPDTNRYLFLQFQQYPGNVPFRYDTIRLHFPANYTFKDKLGFLLNVGLDNVNQDERFTLSNYFFDKSDPSRVLELEFGTPFQFQERIWSKYIEMQVPSPYALTRDYTILPNNGIKPRDGSIHKNLVFDDFNILSLETPIFIDFQFLTKREEKLKQVSYLTTEPFSLTLPVTPEFETLGLKIEHSSQGDFFEIFGTFNGNISEFNSFMNNSALRGKRYHLIYEVTQFEKNIETQTVNYFKYDTFDSPIDHRPIIKFSTTTAIIDVTMKLIDSADDSMIIRKTSYAMLQDEVAKYAAKLTKINIKDTYKPKVYNSKPDVLNLGGSVNSLTKVEKVTVPYGIMYERYNIVTKNKSEQVNDTVWYGIGENQILLYHTDNIVKFVVGKGTDKTGIVPFSFPANTPVFLQFKSSKKLVEVPLFNDSNEVSLDAGVLVFRILSSQMATLTEMKKDGFDQFYIVMKPDTGIDTVVYPGRFLIFNLF